MKYLRRLKDDTERRAMKHSGNRRNDSEPLLWSNGAEVLAGWNMIKKITESFMKINWIDDHFFSVCVFALFTSEAYAPHCFLLFSNLDAFFSSFPLLFFLRFQFNLLFCQSLGEETCLIGKNQGSFLSSFSFSAARFMQSKALEGMKKFMLTFVERKKSLRRLFIVTVANKTSQVFHQASTFRQIFNSGEKKLFWPF